MKSQFNVYLNNKDYSDGPQRILICIIISLLFAGIIFSFYKRNVIDISSAVSMELLAQKNGAQIDSELKDIELSVNTICVYAMESLDSVDSLRNKEYRDNYTSEMKKLVASIGNNTESALCAYLRYNPSYSTPTSGIFMKKNIPAAKKEDISVPLTPLNERKLYLAGGRSRDNQAVIPSEKIKNFLKDVPPTDISKYSPDDIEHVGWYYIPVLEGRALWLEPYYNQNVNINMISYAAPLVKDGIVAGVAGMDIDFNYITKLVSEIKFYKTGNAFIVDKKGRIIYHPVFASGKIYKAPRGFVCSKVPLRNGMILVLEAPVEELNEGRNKTLTIVSIIAIAVLLVFFILINIIGHLNKKKREAEKVIINHLKSIADIYDLVRSIDIENDTYSEIKSLDCNEKPIGPVCNNACSFMQDRIIDNCNPKYIEKMLSFVDLKTLNYRMKDRTTIEEEFINSNNLWCRARFIKVSCNSDGYIKDVIYALEKIDAEKRKENRLIKLSETDQMTGIYNRGGGENKITKLLNEGVKGMFCLLDANNFKSINDTFGHDAGDKVIISIADCLKHTFRNKNIVMRLGGDEFVVYAVDIKDKNSGQTVIKRFFDELESINISELKGRKITVSMGAVVYTDKKILAFEDIYKMADSCTYESKKEKSTSRVTFYK